MEKKGFSLTTLREHTRWIMTLTLILIIPAFIALYGIGGGGGSGGGRQQAAPFAVKVNGVEVPVTKFWQLRTNQLNHLRNQYGPHYEAMFDEADLNRQLIDSLIDQELIVQYAGANGIATGVEEAAREIRDMPVFQGEDGRFDNVRYLQLLGQNQMTEAGFIQDIVRDITRRKVQQSIEHGVQVSPAEVWDENIRRNEQAEFEYLAFESDDYGAELEVDEAELAAFFAEHRESYRLDDRVAVRYSQVVPRNVVDKVQLDDEEIEDFFNARRDEFALQPSARVDFLTVPPENYLAGVIAAETEVQAYFDLHAAEYLTELAGRMRFVSLPLDAAVLGVTVEETALREYYEGHPDEFKEPEQAKVRHILRRVEPGATPEEHESAKAKLLAVRASILSGTLSFADAALEYSDDPGSRENGGEYDFAPRGQYVPEFEEQLYSLPIGQLSEPFKTSFGYHILEPLERKAAQEKTFEQARSELRERLLMEELRVTARERLEGLRDRIGGELTHETAGPEWTVYESAQPFVRGATDIPGIAEDDAGYVSGAVLGLEQGGLTDVLVGRERMYLAQLIEKREPRPMSYLEAHERVTADYRLSRARELARSAAYTLYTELVGGASMEAVAQRYGLEVQDSGLFSKEYDPNNSRRPTVSAKGVSGAALQDFKNAVFASEVGKVGGPIEDSEIGFHIFVVRELDTETLPTLDQVRPQVRRRLAEMESENLAMDVAEALIFYADEHGLEEAARHVLQETSVEVTVETSELFTLEVPAADLGYQIARAAFTLQAEGDVYDAPIPIMGRQIYGSANQQQVLQSCNVIELATRSPAHLPELAEVRERVEENFRRFKGADKARQASVAAETALARAVEQGSFPPPDATRTVDLRRFARSIEADYIAPAKSTRSGYVPNIGRAPSVARTAFTLEPGQLSSPVEVLEEVAKDFELPRGYYILQSLGHETPDRTAFEAEQEKQIRQQLEQSRRDATFRSWLNQLRSQAEITINTELLQPARDEIEDLTEEEEAV